MIAEALQLIQETAQKAGNAAGKVAVIDLPKDPTRFGIAKPDGSIEFHAVTPPPRKHMLTTIDEIEGIASFADQVLGGTPSVWVSESGVRVVIDDTSASQRSDLAFVPFEPTQAHEAILEVRDQWLDQKAFVRLLRITLGGALTESSAQLLRIARVLAFKNSVTGHGKVEQGRVSMGREIEEEVVSEVGDLPETVTLNIRLFKDPAMTQRFVLGCAVDVNTREGLFNLAPLAEALEEAVSEQLNLVYQRINEVVTCPVFRGTP